ncbi:MAG: Haloalkane dehalogenase 2 [Phycisphaerae bacterium]|nr:Haloalkane dehalogenase 2 [Phycisphaerae bacterium]
MLDRVEYPFTSHWLPLDGRRLHYVDEGSGPAVVMLHGNPTWSFYYRELIRELSPHYRIIVPDHLGMGLSDKPQDYPYRLADHIANLERLLDQLGLQRMILVMHDWGGAIGMGYAMRHVEKIAGLVLFNTAAYSGPCPWRIRVCRWPIVGPLLVRGLNGFAWPATWMASKRPGGLPTAVRAGYLHPYQSWRDRVAILRFVQDIPLSANHPTYVLLQKIDAGLAQFRNHPVLIGWGMRDFCFNEYFLNGWIERFPQAQVHRFSDAGHYVVEDAREQILPLIRQFLTRLQY